MHLPPAVSYEVVRSRWHFYALCVLWASAVLVGACFAEVQSHSRLWGMVWLVTAVSAPLSFWAWRRSATGLLQWDGGQWSWSGLGDQAVHSLRVTLDLQAVLMVQLHTRDGKSVWLVLERGTQPARWLALRRALFARHRAAFPATTTMSGDGIWQ